MNNTDILLITPPFTQLNTPYPATAYLSGFLKEQGFSTAQLDLGIETFHKIFCRQGLQDLISFVKKGKKKISEDSQRFLLLSDDYLMNVEAVVAFLQGKEPTLAYQICSGMLPRGYRFESMPDLDELFGKMGVTDKAKYLATLFIEDIGDFIIECVDPNFGFSKYAEKLSLKISDFSVIENELKKDTPITDLMCSILQETIEKSHPKIISISIPFPGNLLSGLKAAKHIREHFPDIHIVMGGGFINTELRDLNHPAFFDYTHYVCLDDGERTLFHLLQHLLKNEDENILFRTFLRKDHKVVYFNSDRFEDFEHSETGTPDYSGLPLEKYVSFIEMANPMHRLWNDGRWNKITIAQGCYWQKCTFCDTSLDYIKRYSKADPAILCDRIESIIEQSGQRGFHFVDEAAPPALLRDLAIEILRRRIRITWWANIRFENAFNADLCRLLAESGCVAVSGGLEVASDRLLKLINKGITIKQVAQVTSHFQQAGIMIHAYLIYGFPTQTEQETIDSLEVVRQLFYNGLIDSAYWHRFTMTVHSPVGQNPEEFHVEVAEDIMQSFAKNEVYHSDPRGCDHEKFSFGLKKALYNYMHQVGFNLKVQEWFDFPVPKTTHSPNLISDILSEAEEPDEQLTRRILWLGSYFKVHSKNKELSIIDFEGKYDSFSIELPVAEARFILETLNNAKITNQEKILLKDFADQFESISSRKFKKFAASKNWRLLRENGLVVC